MAADEDSGPRVVTRTGLLATGARDLWIRREVRVGRAVRHAPGVFVTGGAGLDASIGAALAHVGPAAVVTGWAGCRLLGVPGAEPQPQVSVLVAPENQRVSTAYVRVLPTTRRPRWRLAASGVRVADPSRCVVDAARQLADLAAVRHLVMSAVTCDVVCLPDLSAELEAGGRNGSALCRRAIADAARGAESAPEAELADLAVALARRRRLPSFLLNPTIGFRGRRLGRPDGWFVDLGLGWEMDSRAHHAEDEDFDDTFDRHGRFAAGGVMLLHVTPRRFRQLGTAYGPVLEAAVRARQEAGYRPPPGLEVVARGPVLPEPVRRRPRVT